MVEIPQRIGKYEVECELGRGGMGTVYLARDPVLDRQVALKTLFSGPWIDPEAKERFLREARSAARLQHPNIITIFELGEIDEAPFIAMEYLQGIDLSEAVEEGRIDGIEAKLGLLVQLCRGLAHAHKHGVVHRDIKPSNIIVLGDGTVKLVDFGIARFEGCTFATRTGELLGTPHYMAPEQFTGEELDQRVDVWAVGVLLYQLLSGARPFDGDTVPTLIYRIVHTPLPALDAAELTIPTALISITEKAPAKDRSSRYQELDPMGQDLEATLTAQREGGAAKVSAQLEATARLSGLVAASLPTTPTVEVDPTAPATVAQRLAPAVVSAASVATERVTATGAYQEAGIFGEASGLQVIAASPDEQMIAVGGVDGSIRLWDLATRMKLNTLRSRMHLRTGHGALTRALAFTADGAYLAAGHLDGSISLWKPVSGLELEAKPHHQGAVCGLGFSPDTTILASGGMDATLKLWEMPAVVTGEARRLMRRQPADVTVLAVDPQGRYVATGHTNRCLRIHELTNGRLLATIHGHRNPPSTMAISPAGDLLACGERDGSIRLFQLESRSQLLRLEGHSKTVSSLAFLPDGRRLVSVALDNGLVLWDISSGLQITTLWGGADECFTSVIVIDQGQHLLCGLTDGRIRVWESLGEL